MGFFSFFKFKEKAERPPRLTLADAQKIDALAETVAAMSLKVEQAVQREGQREKTLQARVTLARSGECEAQGRARGRPRLRLAPGSAPRDIARQISAGPRIHMAATQAGRGAGAALRASSRGHVGALKWEFGPLGGLAENPSGDTGMAFLNLT